MVAVEEIVSPQSSARKSNNSNYPVFILIGLLIGLILGIISGFFIAYRTIKYLQVDEGYSVEKTNTISPTSALSVSPASSPSGKINSKIDINAQKENVYNLPGWISTSPSVSTYADQNISAVRIDAESFDSESHFPEGFFSPNPMDWGLIYLDKGPITVTIQFYKPTKLAYVSNIFTGCSNLVISKNFSCYSWSVRGLTASDNVEQLLKDLKGNITKSISSNNEFTQVQITVENMDGIQGDGKTAIDWEKIKFGYK